MCRRSLIFFSFCVEQLQLCKKMTLPWLVMVNLFNLQSYFNMNIELCPWIFLRPYKSTSPACISVTQNTLEVMAHISNVRETSFKWLPLSLKKSCVFIYYTLIWKAFKCSNIWGKKSCLYKVFFLLYRGAQVNSNPASIFGVWLIRKKLQIFKTR